MKLPFRPRKGASRGEGPKDAATAPGRSRYPLRERRASRPLHYDATSSEEESDSEDSLEDRVRPRYMKPWIVNLLLEYDESDDQLEAKYGHVVKVLKEASPHRQDGQDPAAVVYIADGCHYIHTVVPAKAIQTAEDFSPQSGFSSILGQFIVLQNFRVCVKEAARAEDSGFYFRLDHFQVTAMKRWVTRQQDCNREPSVLQKIKQLWLRGLALQPLPCSEPSSVAEVLGEMKQDKLSTLKQNVEDCFSSLDPGNLLNSEQLAVYPDTKWQAERKQDKMQCRDIFTVPAKLLVVDAEEEAALSTSCSPKPAHVASDSENSSDEDHSTISFVNEAETVDGSLDNPWDIFPGMTLTSSKEMSDTQLSLPNVQQMLLASTAEEEEATGSSSCTPDGLQFPNHVPHCSSAQVEPVEVTSPSLLPLYKGVNEESRSKALNSACNTIIIPDTDERIPCGLPLNNSNSHDSGNGLSPVCPTIRSTFLSKTSSGDVEENNPGHLQREAVVVRGAGEKSLETCRKCGAAKRKQLVPDEEESTDTSSRPLHISHKAQDLTSAADFPKPCRLDRRQVAHKPPLKSVTESTPKKSRIEEIHVQPLQESAQSKCAGRHLEKLKKQTATTRQLADSCGAQLGTQQQERVRRAISHHVYQPATAELCSQVHSTRISRALLGWARWVFRNRQKL